MNQPSPLSCAARERLTGWFLSHGRDLPWRRTRDPYAVAVSEFMLQQTRVSVVIGYYRRWMDRFPTVHELAAADEHTVLAQWQGLGYYARARNLHRLARAVVQVHGGEFPPDLNVLRELPGVGEYTAAAIAAFAFDLPAPVVDANVARVLTRWADFRAPVDDAAGRKFLHEFSMAHQMDAKGAGGGSPRLWNSAVMELGALICTSGTPDCLLCPVRDECRAEHPALLPNKRSRPETKEIEETRAFVYGEGTLWLEHSIGPRWKGMWLLPLVRGSTAGGARRLGAIVYPITRYRVTMHLLHFPHPPVRMAKDLAPHKVEKLSSIALPAPHRRAVALGLKLVHSATDA